MVNKQSVGETNFMTHK